MAYEVPNREDVLRAADIFVENGVSIEFGPAKHSHKAFPGTSSSRVETVPADSVGLAGGRARRVVLVLPPGPPDCRSIRKPSRRPSGARW